MTPTMIGLIGTLGGALIAAMPSILDKINPPDRNIASAPITEVQNTGYVWVDSVKFSDSGTKVTVSGTAVPRVEAVGVMISPPDATDPTWSAGTKVSDGKWSVIVNANQKMPSDVEIKAFYKERITSATPVTKASYVIFKLAPTTSTPPPTTPAQGDGCASQAGEGCFTGPGWGPPSIYRTGP
ncbi:hypothetical protein BVU76_28650 [Mycolicibacterium porcinum]|nr:hypothetical protein BVU76_28650 [Mycolicibacterium porcinum]